MAAPNPQDTTNIVDVTQLENVPEPVLPPESPPVDTPTDVVNAAAAATTASQTALEKEIARQTESINKQSADTTELSNMLRSELDPNAKSQARRLQEEQDKLGVIEGYKSLQNINNQIASATAAYQQGITNIEGKPIARQFITGQQAQLRLQQAAEIGALTAAAQAQQGNIALAEQIAARTVNAEFADREQRISTLQSLIELNYQDLTAAEKRRADLVLEQTKQEEAKLKEEKTQRQQIVDLAIEARKNNADNGTVTGILESKTIEEALFNAGESLATKASDDILSPSEAATLGVPYGTTERDAAAMGIIPKSVLTPQDKMAAEFKLYKDVDTATKDARTVGTQVNIMQSSLDAALEAVANGQSLNAASQGVIVTFNKILDPTSVVRESEYARSAEGVSLISRLEGKYQQLSQGGAGLTVEELQSFVDLANELASGYEEEQLGYLKRARVQAENWGLDLNNVLTPQASSLLEKDDANRLREYYQSNPDEQQIINSIIEENPDISDYNILRIMGEGFNQDLSKSVKGKAPEGSIGGQCTTFLHTLADFPSIGDYKDQKFASVRKYGTLREDWDPKVGDIIVTNESEIYGHTAMVNKILPDGTLVLTESNYAKPETVTHTRTISPNAESIYGAITPNKITV